MNRDVGENLPLPGARMNRGYAGGKELLG